MLRPLDPYARGKTGALSIALLLGLLALVCVRSWVFVVYPHAHMDSDQAVFGLMAKDFAAGRPFSFFMYGQRYMLAVSSWLCAPLFAWFGPSVITLKLPMFAMNLACVAMLWIGLRKRSEIGPWGAALCILPFAVPSVIVASRLVEHQGGNVEPFFFVLLAYFVRNRPLALGVVFGIAFLNREFALSGFIALIVTDIAQGLFRSRWKGRALSAVTIVAIAWAVRELAALNPTYRGVAASAELRDVGAGLLGYVQEQLGPLLGSGQRRLNQFNVPSRYSAGHAGLRYLVVVWVIVLAFGLRRLRRTDLDSMPVYLALIGLAQMAAFVLFCPAPFDPFLIRYALLSLLAFVGLSAHAWQQARLRLPIAAVLLVLFAFNLRDNIKLVHEYATHTPQHENQTLARQLLARNIHYAISDYWVAYDVTWLTDEQVIISVPRGGYDRMDRYRAILKSHASEVVYISDKPCRHGEPLLRWYLCAARRKQL